MKLKIISDGTNVGTKLIDEDSGEVVHGISKITWETGVDELLTKTIIEFFNIPVEIASKANVDLYEHIPPNWTPMHSKSFEKDIKIISELSTSKAVLNTDTKIIDSDTNKSVGAIQNIKWEATPGGAITKIKRIKFDNKDW